jgi:hypothetical protein
VSRKIRVLTTIVFTVSFMESNFDCLGMKGIDPDYPCLQTNTFRSSTRYFIAIGLYPTMSFYLPSEHLSNNISFLSYLSAIVPLQKHIIVNNPTFPLHSVSVFFNCIVWAAGSRQVPANFGNNQGGGYALI